MLEYCSIFGSFFVCPNQYTDSEIFLNTTLTFGTYCCCRKWSKLSKVSCSWQGSSSDILIFQRVLHLYHILLTNKCEGDTFNVFFAELAHIMCCENLTLICSLQASFYRYLLGSTTDPTTNLTSCCWLQRNSTQS